MMFLHDLRTRHVISCHQRTNVCNISHPMETSEGKSLMQSEQSDRSEESADMQSDQADQSQETTQVQQFCQSSRLLVEAVDTTLDEEVRTRRNATPMHLQPFIPWLGLDKVPKHLRKEGRLIRQPRYNRLIYYTKKNDTVIKIGRKFKVCYKKILWDNAPNFILINPKTKLMKCTPIVLPSFHNGTYI